MKKLQVIAMADQRTILLQELLQLGCVEITEPDVRLSDPEWAKLLERSGSRLSDARTALAEAQSALDTLKRYSGIKDGLFPSRKVVTQAEFLGEESLQIPQQIVSRIRAAQDRLNDLRSQEERLLVQQASLQPWRDLELPLETAGTSHVLYRIGVIPVRTEWETLKTALAGEEQAAELYEVSADRQQRYCLLICHRDDEAAVMETLRPFGFSTVTFRDLTGIPRENLSGLEQQLAEIRQAQIAEISSIAKEAPGIEILRQYTDRLRTETARETGAGRLMTNGTVLFFEGWVPADRLQELEVHLENLDCAWEAAEPTEEDIPDVPVQLKNNWFTRPLNMVTEMYSLPSYGGVDPNPLMAPFFILFYGIMLADMGYGSLMILAGIIIRKKYRPTGTMGHMFELATLCGISTFIMGAVTGGFFGDFLTQAVKLTTGADFALPALFTPLNDTLMILVGSMALGLVHIMTGMAVSFVRKLRRKQFLDALFEEVTWWLVFAGIACMVLGMTDLLLYAGIFLVVIGPLATGKGIGKITGIFASLYNHITGYFGDILSYARLMALMLAGSVIAQVFNTLGAIPGNIVVFLVISLAGNALNFALNLLGCYVHDLRLQCLEYFGKFYEDGGKPFRPLTTETKYTEIKRV